MGRKRSQIPEWVPRDVIIRRGYYVYRPYGGVKDGKPYYPKGEKRICSIDATPRDFFAAFDEMIAKPKVRNLQWLLDNYHQSDRFKRLAATTQRDYELYKKAICAFPVNIAGRPSTFGKVHIDKLTRIGMQKYVDKKASTPALANRHLSYIKGAWNWSRNRLSNIPDNPCTGIEKHKETSRTRYIADWEQALFYLVAIESSYPHIAPASELAYLQRGRGCEVWDLTEHDVDQDGIYLTRRKGSNPELTLWTPRLRAAYQSCRQINASAPTPMDKKKHFLLHDKFGQRFKASSISTAITRIKKIGASIGAKLPPELEAEAKNAGAKMVNGRVLMPTDFTFHDIKAKGVTDHETRASGHNSDRMKSVYIRKGDVVQATK